MNHVQRLASRPIGVALLVPAALAAGAVARSRPGVPTLLVAAALVALGALWTLGTIGRLRAAEALALRDPLTTLPNRALLEDRIEQALARSRRTGEPFALVVLDLNGFKEVNDIRGHRAGDEVLQRLAERLESVVRESDTVARVGGDEFVVLSLGTRDQDEAALLVGRLRAALRSPLAVEGVTVELDASIGYALHPDDGATPEELLACADGQMYATKRDADATPLRGSLDAGIVREFETALERNELVVHYQPILRLDDGSVVGAEALVRRVHPDRGVVSPAEFIPHVERTSLIRAVTVFVADDALRTARALGAERSFGVSVNVPYRAVDDPELASALEALLSSTGVAPSTLTLEIVPGGPAAGSDLDRDALARLRALGVRIALDDFGRASSLTAVRTLPLDQVKIDASFVHGLGRNTADSAVVHALIGLAHGLGLEVVAEGVETSLAWDTALDGGCDLAQGFYAAPPMPRKELVDWLDRFPAAVARAAS